MGDFVSTELDGAVAVVTIDHPPVNALSAPLLEELEAEIDRLDADDDVRAIVLVGAGDRAFVAGADISEFPSLRESAAEANERGSARGIQKLGHRMDAARTPFVAAIHGFCLGRRARARHVLRHPRRLRRRAARPARDQARPHPRRRRHAASSPPRRHRARAVPEHDRRLHRRSDGVRLGARREGRPRDELRETALGIARTIAARSPVSIGVLRELARTTRDLSLEEGLRREADGFRRCLESEDGAEGVAAFLEKREPQFTGR